MLQGDLMNSRKSGNNIPGLPRVIVSPADARVTAIYYLAAAFVWHKREQREE